MNIPSKQHGSILLLVALLLLAVQQQAVAANSKGKSKKRPLKILYTVTTLAEYDVGTRATTKGFDRLQGVLIPVIKEGVESMLSFGYEVDVYIVAFYKMTRYELIRNSLPSNVNVTVWDEAAPISYKGDEWDKPNTKLVLNTIGLSRQHRFVVKDHLFRYDFFCNFEDDMLIKGDHIQNYIQMTRELYRLRETAPDGNGEELHNTQGTNNFYGPLTKEQLKRMLPGFIRVEVLLDEDQYGTQIELDPVPITDRPNIDPKPCCHLRNSSSASPKRPASPHSDKLFIWEVGIKPVGIRHMPEREGEEEQSTTSSTNSSSSSSSSLKWVLMQRGPSPRKGEKDFLTISDYWSNRDHYFQERRMPSISFNGINNQGGWMATRQQIWEWHTEVCPGGFLVSFFFEEEGGGNEQR